MEEFLGENGAVGQNGVGHPLVIFPGIGRSPAGEEGLVYLHPYAVGIDKSAVQVKKQHRLLRFVRIFPDCQDP